MFSRQNCCLGIGNNRQPLRSSHRINYTAVNGSSIQSNVRLTAFFQRSYNTLPALKRRVEYYKRYLKGMPASLGTDLLNIRDELLGSLNQFSYMLTLSG